MASRPFAAAVVGFALVPRGCGGAEVTSAELTQIVERDAVVFDVRALPDQVVDRLARHRVVLVGETHLIREHRQLMAGLVEALHARGFRQLLFEFPHLADWVVSGFVLDGHVPAGWQPPTPLNGELVTAIRDFNRSLPEAERFDVRGIDVNLDDYGGAQAFVWSLREPAEQLGDPGPLATFLQGPYSTPEIQSARLGALQAELTAARPRSPPRGGPRGTRRCSSWSTSSSPASTSAPTTRSAPTGPPGAART